MKTTLDIETVITELKREAARQGCTVSELDISDWRKPTADEIRALRRESVSADAAREVGHARRIYEARLRSEWDSHRGAIETARGGNVARLVDCLRARKPLADNDRDCLAAFVATKVRRCRWPPELVRALGGGARSEGDFDLLAELVEETGRRPGGVRDLPVHRAARLAEVLLFLWGRRVPDAARTALIAYACDAEGGDAGVALEPELPGVRGGDMAAPRTKAVSH
jgi:hypothetical protein